MVYPVGFLTAACKCGRGSMDSSGFCRQQSPHTGVAPGSPSIRTEIVHVFLKDKDSLQLLGGGEGVLREHLRTPVAILLYLLHLLSTYFIAAKYT